MQLAIHVLVISPWPALLLCLGTRHEIADWFDPQKKLEEEETEAAMLATAIAASMNT